MRKLSEFEISENQEKKFDSLIRAIEQCKKAGLVLVGKQDVLCGYRKESFSDDVHCPLHQSSKRGLEIPHIFHYGLQDSGADDTEYFLHNKVEL